MLIVKQDGDMVSVLLDRTIFHPQGGGQPSDEGQIISPTATLDVKELKIEENRILHRGTFSSGDGFAADE